MAKKIELKGKKEKRNDKERKLFQMVNRKRSVNEE